MRINKFNEGDRAFYDGVPVKVVTVDSAVLRPGSYDLVVLWPQGELSVVWDSDLMTEAEYHEFCAEEY